MFKRLLLEPQGPLTYLLALMLIVLIAIGAGLWVGWTSVGFSRVPGISASTTPTRGQRTKAEDVPLNEQAPPLFLMADPHTPEEWSDFLGEIEMAASRNIHRFIVPMRLAWREPWDALPLLQRLDEITATDPEAMFILSIDMNPNEEWLRAHPESAVTNATQKPGYASPFSPAWKNQAVQETLYLIGALQDSTHARRIKGYLISGMYEGSWRFEGGVYDTSLATEAAFEAWLARTYGNLESVPSAWGLEALPRPLTPSYPQEDPSAGVFFNLPGERQQVDYLRFLSEGISEVLARIAAEVRSKAGDDVELLARYGFGLELEYNGAGHFALHPLQSSELDGFIGPVSYASRGSGGTGGPMAPIHSARAHGKKWYLLDDTRTGVARDPLTGAITRIEGLRPEDVYTVQERNFSQALTQGLGLIWADPHAQGWLHDEGQWEKFGQLAAIYCETYPQYRLERAEDGVDPQPSSATETPEGDSTGGYAAQTITLQVVVDEESRFLQRSNAALNNALLLEGRDAALMSGVPTQFVLLDDVIEERTPAAAVYLFLNTFQLTIVERERLQTRFENEKAAVIWLYTPGYFRDTPRTDHITSTARITVEPFSKPERAGSRMAINGRWMRQNDTFGYRGTLSPLFYINDNESDVIALFEGSNKPSVAMKTLETGWTSVLVTDAGISAHLLRELLRILEQQIYFQPTNGRYVDAAYFGEGLIGIHARQVGERSVDLGDYYNVTDLLDSGLGWPERDSFLVQLDHGETRLLHLQELE